MQLKYYETEDDHDEVDIDVVMPSTTTATATDHQEHNDSKSDSVALISTEGEEEERNTTCCRCGTGGNPVGKPGPAEYDDTVPDSRDGEDGDDLRAEVLSSQNEDEDNETKDNSTDISYNLGVATIMNDNRHCDEEKEDPPKHLITKDRATQDQERSQLLLQPGTTSSLASEKQALDAAVAASYYMIDEPEGDEPHYGGGKGLGGGMYDEPLRDVRFATISEEAGGLAHVPSKQELEEIEYAKNLSLGISTTLPLALAPRSSIPTMPHRSLGSGQTSHARFWPPSSPFLANNENNSIHDDEAAFYESFSPWLDDPPVPKSRHDWLDDPPLLTSSEHSRYNLEQMSPSSNREAQAQEEQDLTNAIRMSLQQTSQPPGPGAMDPLASTGGAAFSNYDWGQGGYYAARGSTATQMTAGLPAKRNWLTRAQSIFSRPTTPPAPPQNDRGGSMVVRGSKSQYTFEGGEVACTSICLVAAKNLLILNPNEWNTIHAKTLDHWIEEGIARHRAHGTKHSSVEQIWGLQLFADVAGALEMGCPLQGTMSNQDTLRTALQQAHESAFQGRTNQSLAVVFTKSAETVLCATDRFTSEWLLMDSHGQSHEKDKRAYIKIFQSLDAVVVFLLKKYPSQNFGDGLLQSEMYDLFEVFPIVLRNEEPGVGQKIPLEEEISMFGTATTPSTPLKSPKSDCSPYTSTDEEEAKAVVISYTDSSIPIAPKKKPPSEDSAKMEETVMNETNASSARGAEPSLASNSVEIEKPATKTSPSSSPASSSLKPPQEEQDLPNAIRMSLQQTSRPPGPGAMDPPASAGGAAYTNYDWGQGGYYAARGSTATQMTAGLPAKRNWLTRAQSIFSRPTTPPAPPQNDRGGSMVVRGSKSQYTFEGGEVACTSICLVAAKNLLILNPNEWNTIHAKTLDHWIEEGIARHRAHGTKHSSVEQIWGLQLFADVAGALEMGCPLQGTMSNQDTLRTALQQAHEFAFQGRTNQSLAVVFTKSGETVLCATDRFASEWLLMDSHGQSHEKDKRAYIKIFQSLDAVVAFLLKKYPSQNFGDGLLQSEMYDLFEVFPIVLRNEEPGVGQEIPLEEEISMFSTATTPSTPLKSSKSDCSPCTATDEEEAKAVVISYTDSSIPIAPKKKPPSEVYAKMEETVNETNTSSARGAEPSLASNSAEIEKPATKTSPSSSPVSSSLKPPPPGADRATVPDNKALPTPSPMMLVFDESDYEDPVLCHIMADPVTCEGVLVLLRASVIFITTSILTCCYFLFVWLWKDGHTYDRPVIERCFQERVQAEEKRRQEEKNEEKKDDDTCCKGNRGPIELISPISGKVVSGVLFPNHTLEHQIVRLMEANAFGLPDDEIEDWKKRRIEKKANDRIREEEERVERARQEQMRRNAEDAINKNRDLVNHGKDGGSSRASMPLDLSLLVRLDRHLHDSSQRLSSADTGLSCALAETSMRIPEVVAMRDGTVLRCMVNRCAMRLEKEHFSWCARCGRIVCDECLAFDVTDFHSPKSQTVHKICVDCVAQLVDAMETGDIHLRQKRVLLVRSLESRHSARFANRAALVQEQVARHEARTRYAAQRSKIEETIRGLEAELSSLQEEVQKAAARASAAREDRPDPDGNLPEQDALIQQLQMECSDLEQEYNAAEADLPPQDDEDAVIRYLESLSRLNNRFESKQFELAIALSTLAHTQDPANRTERPQNGAKKSAPRDNSEKLSPVERLEREFEELRSRLNAMLEGPDPVGEEPALSRAVDISALEASLDEVQTRLAVTKSQSADTGAQGRYQRAELPEDVKNAIADLNAIGINYEDWPLPLGLNFPSSRMEQQLEILRNTLQLRRVESERAGDEEWTRLLLELDARQDTIEAEIARTRGNLADAQKHAQEEVQRARVRAEERRQRELARLERERVLREQAEKAERERQELLARHREDEEATRVAFARAAGSNNDGARSLGGIGDLRMCKRCRAGPMENKSCPDLKAHNDDSTSYKGETVSAKVNPNHCPHCGWFDDNWHNWPFWDGIYGPH